MPFALLFTSLPETPATSLALVQSRVQQAHAVRAPTTGGDMQACQLGNPRADTRAQRL